MKSLMIEQPKVTLEVSAGERAEGFFEKFFGSAPTPHDEMPDDADVDETFIIKLK